jgi:formylmethanofuran dehydrogenase subunit E
MKINFELEFMKSLIACEPAYAFLGKEVSEMEQSIKEALEECGNCGELDHEFNEFKINGKHVFLCSNCTKKRRETNPRSEVL